MSPYGTKWLENKKNKEGNKKKKRSKAIIEGFNKFKKWFNNLEWGDFDD